MTNLIEVATAISARYEAENKKLKVRIKQLEKEIGAFEGMEIALDHYMDEGRKLTTDYENQHNHFTKIMNEKDNEIEQLEVTLKEIEQECKKMRVAGWYDDGEFKMLKSGMTKIIINVDGLAEKALEDK